MMFQLKRFAAEMRVFGDVRKSARLDNTPAVVVDVIAGYCVQRRISNGGGT